MLILYKILEERNTEAIEKEKQRLLTMLKNKEISTTEYIKKIEEFLKLTYLSFILFFLKRNYYYEYYF